MLFPHDTLVVNKCNCGLVLIGLHFYATKGYVRNELCHVVLFTPRVRKKGIELKECSGCIE